MRIEPMCQRATFFSEELGDLCHRVSSIRGSLARSTERARPIGREQALQLQMGRRHLNGNMGFELINASLQIVSSDGTYARVADNPP